MKSLIKISKYFAFLAGVLFLFNSCTKVKVPTPMGDAGPTLVKIIGGATPSNIAKMPVDFVPTPTRLLVCNVRRDVPNATELAKTMIVTVKDDLAAVTAANPAYVQLPAAWYTIQTDGVKAGGQGGTYTFTFKPGEFAKEIYITIPNATLFDPSSLYGLGFTITTADAGGVISTQKSIVVEIGAKNNYDGVYAVTGPMVDVTNTAIAQWFNPAFADPFVSSHGGAWELHLITTGAATCTMYDNTIWGDFFHPILNGTANSGWGAYALVVDFNPATGTIANIHNYYGESAHGGSGPPLYSASNTRSAILDPTGINKVQGNKDVLIKYFLIQPSVIPTPPSIRVTFDEKWAYTGPR